MNRVEKDHEKCLDVCNSLLRGERSAVETYDKAVEKYNSEPSAPALRKLRQTHSRAVGLLEENVRSMGGTPDTDSGAWGTFANMVQSTANLFGEDSAVSALQKGEEHGKNDYQDALDNDDVLPGCKDMIRTHLLPGVLTNISTLETLGETI